MDTTSHASQTRITWLLRPNNTCSVEKIKQRAKYFCRMTNVNGNWFWDVVPSNGKAILMSDPYKNKAQCRNVSKRFAEAVGIEWREL